MHEPPSRVPLPAADGPPAAGGIRLRIDGYEMLGIVGRGGMGVVYRARHVALDRLVAIKMVRSAAQADARELARFHFEAEAVARLQHPHIVQVFQVGTQDGLPYIAFEYVDGGNLAQKLGGRPLPAPEAAALVETLARAVQHAHSNGIVHRDLKPANVLLSARGEPKITDFGLAKHVAQGGPGDSVSLAIVGTASYMAPEQAWGDSRVQPVGPPTDIYALGAILYETLVGRPPFQADSPRDTLELVWNREPVPPSKIADDVPPDLETICLRCLQKDPRSRYETAEDLAEDLRRFRAHEPILARPVSRTERMRLWCRRNPLAAVLSSALAIVFTLGLGGIVMQTVEARHQADQARINADDARSAQTAAEENARRAERESEAARAAQGRAETQTEIARRATDEARRHETAARDAAAKLARSLYSSAMLAAQYEISLDRWAAAGRFLDECPPEHRHFEWHFRERERTGSRHTFRVRDAQGGRVQPVSAALAARAGRIVSGWSDGRVRIHDAVTGRLLDTFGEKCESVAVTPDGRWLVTTGTADSFPRLWDVAGRRQIATIEQPVGCFAVAPDGTRAALGTGQDVWIVDLPSGRLREILPGRGTPGEHRGHVFTVQFDRDGKRLCVGSRTVVRERPFGTRLGGTQDGKDAGRIDVWELAAGTETPPPPTVPPPSSAADPRAVPAPGTKPEPDTNGAPTTKDAPDSKDAGKTSPPPRSGPSRPLTAAQRAALVNDILKNLPPLKLPEPVLPDLRSPLRGPFAVAPTRSRRVAELSLDVPNDIQSLAFAPDGDRVYVQDWDKARPEDARYGLFVHLPARRTPDASPATGATQPPAASQLPGALQGAGAPHAANGPKLPEGLGWLRGVAVDPTGTLLAVSSADGRVTLLEAGTFAVRRTLVGHDSDPGSVAFAPHAPWLLTVSQSDGTVKLWTLDRPQGRAQARPWSIAAIASCAAFAPRGDRVAYAGIDGALRLLDAETGAELLAIPPRPTPSAPDALPDQDARIVDLVFDRSGTSLVAAYASGTVRTWSLETRTATATFACPIPKSVNPTSAWMSLDLGQGPFGAGSGLRLAPGGEYVGWTGSTERPYDPPPSLGKVILSRPAVVPPPPLPEDPEDEAPPSGTRLSKFAFPKRSVFDMLPAMRKREVHVRVWHVPTGREVVAVTRSDLLSAEIAFSHDGRRVVSNVTAIPYVDRPAPGPLAWDLTTSREIAAPAGAEIVDPRLVHPDGMRTVRFEDGALRLEQRESGRAVLILTAETPYWNAVFAPDGRRMLALRSDRLELLDARPLE